MLGGIYRDLAAVNKCTLELQSFLLTLGSMNTGGCNLILNEKSFVAEHFVQNKDHDTPFAYAEKVF